MIFSVFVTCVVHNSFNISSTLNSDIMYHKKYNLTNYKCINVRMAQ